MRVDIQKLTAANAARWQAMRLKPGVAVQADKVVARIWSPTSKARYQAIADATSVPPLFQVLAHERESDCNFERSLAQGDRLTARSVNVPAGRIPPPAEPPFTFEAAAIDGLVACDHVDKWTDWSIPGLLTKEELWNGAGYYLRGLPSAYVWAGTDQYQGGKFVEDGRFDPHAWDHQLGVAALLCRLLVADPAAFAGHYSPVLTAAHPALTEPVAAPVHDTAWVQTQINLLASREPYQSAIAAALAELVPPRALPIAVDGDYGAGTKAAVRGFQRAHGGLLDDGKAGRTTQAAIELAVTALT